MKKYLSIMFIAVVAMVALISCNKEINPVLMDFKVNDKQGQLVSGGQPYKIVEVRGKSQKELYNMVKSNIMKSYQNPKDVMSEDEPSTLVVNGYEEHFMLYDDIGTKNVSASYTFTFEFKDGKIKVTPVINFVSFEDVYGDEDWDFANFINGALKRNEPTIPKKYKPEIQKAENIINTLLNVLLWSSIDKKEKDNW